MSRPLLIGEDNPYGSEPKYALFPYPKNSAGHRLCHKVLGMQIGEYIRAFDRINLCDGKWSERKATIAALQVKVDTLLDRTPLVLCGAKVSRAFGLEFRPFTTAIIGRGQAAIILPHPSGRCRIWNDPGAYEKARALVNVLLTPPAESV